MKKRLSMKDICGSKILSGAMRGQDAFARLIREVGAEPTKPVPVFLDFNQIEVATASFLRESVLAFRQFIRNRRSMLYPVIANPNEVVSEELSEILTRSGDAMMTCRLNPKDVVSDSALIGYLDPKQQLTFKLVCQRGETDARELMRDFGQSEKLKHATAWNNRLSSLALLGIILEVSRGRTKRYRPVLEEGVCR